MSDQICLKRHLLYACVQAYHPRTPGYSSAPARWLAPALEIGGAGIDFALVGRFAEGIVIAFRGTLPPLDLTPDGTGIIGPPFFEWPAVIDDWRNDLSARPQPDAPTGARPRLPGQVHPGFAGSLDRLWAGIVASVDGLRGGDPTIRLYLTGHSKGGALANLGAFCARRTWPQAAVKAATFGAARAGDGVFAQGYQAEGIDCQRFEVAGDLVPDLPPDGVPVGTGHAVAFRRAPGAPLILPDPIAAHLPYHDFGYDKHVYEDGSRPEWA
jgi:hypothetical protein